tara:strand:+ start:847 stop:1170 length:324 start_codon:yes stop_codon:yes gene_type:complete
MFVFMILQARKLWINNVEEFLPKCGIDKEHPFPLDDVIINLLDLLVYEIDSTEGSGGSSAVSANPEPPNAYNETAVHETLKYLQSRFKRPSIDSLLYQLNTPRSSSR